MSEFRFSGATRTDETATLEVEVPETLKYFDGHFPGDPIVPGVAQIVALAQRQAETLYPELGDIRGLRRVKFMEALRPGDTLRLHFTLSDARAAGEAKVDFRITRGDVECSRGALVFQKR